MPRRKSPPPVPPSFNVQPPSSSVDECRNATKGPFSCWGALRRRSRRRRRKSATQQRAGENVATKKTKKAKEDDDGGGDDGITTTATTTTTTTTIATQRWQQQQWAAPSRPMLPPSNDQFHYFGIPLRTPAEYYRFLEMPYRTRHEDYLMGVDNDDDGQGNGKTTTTTEAARNGTGGRRGNLLVNVLGIGRDRKKKKKKMEEENKQKTKRKKLKNEEAEEWERRRRMESRLEMLTVVNGWRTTGGMPPMDVEQPDDASTCCTCALPSTSAIQCRAQQQQQAKPLFGRLCVQLCKMPGQQLGLGIAGGSDKPMAPTISYLRPGFVAHRSDQIQVGDRLIGVNGMRVDCGCSHAQVLALLRNSGSNTVELELEYDLNAPELRPRRDQRLIGASGIGCGLAEIVLRDNDDDDGTQQQLGKEAEERGLFGMTLRGGAYGPDPVKSRPLTVTGIRAGGAAHREGRLRVGDRLLAVNGISVVDSTLYAAINLIRSSSRARLTLTIEYDISLLASLRKVPGPLLLEIEKVPGVEFGTELAIRQVPIGQNEHRKAVIVQRLMPASVADRCGAVQPGDELLAIDGISLELVGGLAEAYQLLRSQSAILRLELVPVGSTTMLTMPECKAATMGRFAATIGREWRQQQPAQQSAHTAGSRPRSESAFGSDEQQRQQGQTGTQRRRSRQQNADDANNIDQRRDFGQPPKHRSESPQIRRQGSVSARLSIGPGLLGSVCHTESMELALGQEQAHSWPGFGIVLARQKIPAAGGGATADEMAMGMPLVVAQIERGSPADKCGVLQPGDRVLCINDWHTADGTLEEANHLLRALSTSGARATNLLVEFNVIEPVLPPGPGSLFVVRLAKRGNCLGIVCRSQQQRPSKGPATGGGGGELGKGEPLIISHIRIGSVAHRCGSIQVGDRVHSIDDIPLDACTVQEAMRLLQRSAQVIKLCIAKGGGQEQDLLEPAGPQTVIYTVELARKGHPLGITIASAGGLLDPIVISQLAPGGLAERTGALHVGDRILAVNGESLEGKKVSQVTQLLQQCPDPVSIKLCRLIATNNNVGGSGTRQQEQWRNLELAEEHSSCLGIIDECNSSGNKLGTPIKSVDSAMDSLEDSPTNGQQHGQQQHQLRQHGNVGLTAAPHLRPSTSNNFQQADLISGTSSDPYSVTGWDSGLSSAAATENQGPPPAHPSSRAGGQTTATAVDKCCECQLGSAASCSSTSPQSSSSSSGNAAAGRKDAPAGGEKEDWMRILEALETVGEDEMLRKLEECILNGQASNYVLLSERNNSQAHLLPSECKVLSRRFAPNYIGSSAVASNYAQTAGAAPPPPPLFTNQLANYARPSLLKRTTNPTMSPNSQHRKNHNNNNSIPLEQLAPSMQEAASSHANNEQQHSQPQTPVLGVRRNGLNPSSSTISELPPPMPSPRPLGSAEISIASFLHSTATSSTSTFAPPPPAMQTEQQQQRAISSTSTIPFITSPIENSGSNEEEENECGGTEDKFDELSEVFSVQLVWCPITKSFGFSVCDGPIGEEDSKQLKQQQQQQGIYIRSVISEGPAERSGRIQPGDRILQINGRSIQFLTCDLALPLLATEKVDLLLLRRRSHHQLPRRIHKL